MCSSGRSTFHPSPGLEPERLPGRQRDLAQHLEAQVLVALLPVTSAGALATRDLPDLRDQRAQEGHVVFQQIVEPCNQMEAPMPMEHGLVLMPCAISARSRKRRAWSFIQPAWNAASWRLSQNTSRRRRSA